MSLSHVLTNACQFVNYSVEHAFHRADSRDGGCRRAGDPLPPRSTVYKIKAVGGAQQKEKIIYPRLTLESFHCFISTSKSSSSFTTGNALLFLCS